MVSDAVCEGAGELVERGALFGSGLDRVAELVDREARDVAAVAAAHVGECRRLGLS